MSILFSTDAYSLELRDPELQDTDTGVLGTAYHISMSGKVRAYRKTPDYRRLVLNFTELTCRDIDEIVDFILLVAGQLVTLNDWQGNTYNGYIVNNPFTLRNTTRSGTQFTIEYEIIEEPPSPSTPITAMLFEDSESMEYEDTETMLYEG